MTDAKRDMYAQTAISVSVNWRFFFTFIKNAVGGTMAKVFTSTTAKILPASSNPCQRLKTDENPPRHEEALDSGENRAPPI
jgi:hypothetical protein